MIIGIEGSIGSGKTIAMVRYLYKDRYELKNRVLANFGLKFKHEPLDVLKILEMNEQKKQFDNVSIGIDEITVFADCRRSQSKMNLLISYFILQTRKRNVQLYYTTQDIGMVDIRLFKHTDIIVICDFIYDENEQQVTDWRRYAVIDVRNKRQTKITRFNMNISKYYDLYDTKEVILPPI